jgi:hypothetical protein
MKTRDELQNTIRVAAELLEDRIAPATLPPLDISNGIITGTFADSNGDIVTVRIEGSAGRVEFRDADRTQVDDGDEIASVIITGASSDFALTYSLDAPGGSGAFGLVAMGDITSDKVIRGIFSVPRGATSGFFLLGSFVGAGFSAGGGLSADDVVGNADGIGIQVNSLGAGRSINIRSFITGDLIILGSLGGSITVGGAGVGQASAWQINKTVTPTAQIAVGGAFFGTFEARGVFAGDVHIGGEAKGVWTFNKSVPSTAQFTAHGWENVQVLKNWGGHLFAITDDVKLSVGGHILGTSVFSGEGQLELNVEGNVQAGAAFAFTSDITATVGGNLSGNWTSGNDVALSVSDNVSDAVIAAGSSLTLTVSGDMSGSRVDGTLDVTVDISGRLVGSEIRGSPDNGTDTRILVQVDLDVVDSNISAVEKVAMLTVGRSLIASAVQSDDDVRITVGGSVSKSTVTSSEADVRLSVARNVTRSTITATASNVFVTVDGTMNGKAIAGEDLIADVGELTGSLSADLLDLVVQGDVSASARIQANEVDDSLFGDADSIGFEVRGDFAGQLNVIDFDSDAVGTSVLVEGDVLKSARFNVAGTFGDVADESFRFGGDFLGVLNIGGDIDVDITFSGNVNQVIIGGLVGTTGAANFISVEGRLKFLSSSSLFAATTPGQIGSFQNGAGVASAILSVQDHFITVIPAA